MVPFLRNLPVTSNSQISSDIKSLEAVYPGIWRGDIAMSRGVLRLPPAVRMSAYRALSTTARLFEDPRVTDLGRVIKDEYSFIRDNYGIVRILT